MKTGDRVRIVKTIYKADELSVGATGVIMLARNGDYEVRPDSDPYPEDADSNWPFYANELELIQ